MMVVGACSGQADRGQANRGQANRGQADRGQADRGQAASVGESGVQHPPSDAGDPAAKPTAAAVRDRPDWQHTVHRRIANGQYRIRPVDGGPGYRAYNRAHRLHVRFDGQAAHLAASDADGQPDPDEHAFSLRFERFGRLGQVAAVGDGKLAAGRCADQTFVDARGACIERLQIRRNIQRNQVTEWWHNRPDGLEQGWTIAERPDADGQGPVVLELAVDGAAVEVDEDGRGADLTDQADRRLRYAKLRARDARGAALSARMTAIPGGLAVRVDDADAHYPITVDPLLTSPSWTAEGDQSNARFGFSVSSAGDVNADGFDDVIVGARYFDDGEDDEGLAFVYHGGAGGLSATAAWTAESDQEDAHFGHSVSGAGDVNGDGFDDVIVGAKGYDDEEYDEGRVYVYHGSASGLSATAAWTADGDQEDAHFGTSVSGAGDVNGDGFDDVIVGAPEYENGQYDEGGAFVYHGAASGLSTAADWSAESGEEYADFGRSVSGAGDVNGDGFDDVIVGAPDSDHGQNDEGRAFVYHGGAGGLSAGGIGGLSAGGAWTAESDQSDAHFGRSVSGAGDVNGDGFDDVIIGANTYENGEDDEGRAYVYRGAAGGLLAGAAWTAESDKRYTSFGRSVSAAGDVNGDGFDDVIVGADAYENGRTNEGQASVYFGQAAGLPNTADWTAEGNDNYHAYFGKSVSNAGDVNGDGFDDVIVGAPQYSYGQDNEGRTFVYRGAGDNRAPLAADDSATTDEDTPVTIDVLANDSDPDGDRLTGTPSADEIGTHSVRLAADDGMTSTEQSFEISVTATDVNDPPVAVEDRATTDQDTPITVDVLANDSDRDGDALSLLIDTVPSHGDASVAGAGGIEYAPDSGFSGQDSLVYRVNDSRGAAASATLTIDVLPAPTNVRCGTSECAAGESCYLNQCYPSCDDTADCTNSQDTCYSGRCAASPCDRVVCRAGESCEEGLCVGDDACAGMDCAAGEACYAGVCYAACEVDADCSDHDGCQQGACVPEQSGDAGNAGDVADAGPTQRSDDVSPEGGCGCSSQSAHPAELPGWALMVVFVAGLGAARRRRRDL